MGIRKIKLHSILFVLTTISCSDYVLSVEYSVDQLVPGNWYEVPGTNLSALDPEDNPKYNPNYPKDAPWHGLVGQKGVMSGWGGAAFDCNKQRLLVWNGGHNAYGGNEVYAFEVASLSWKMLHPPYYDIGVYLPQYQYSLLNDWTPSTVHTYDGLVYAENLNALIYTGSRWFGRGMFSNPPKHVDFSDFETNVFLLDENRWETEVHHKRVRMPNKGNAVLANAAIYDHEYGLIWRMGVGSNGLLQSYNINKDKWNVYSKLRDKGSAFSFARSIEFDPISRLIVIIGSSDRVKKGGNTEVIDISNPNKPKGPYEVNTTGSNAPELAKEPGFTFDSKRKQFVAWVGDQVGSVTTDIYTLVPGEWEWEKISTRPDNLVIPSTQEKNGTWGRFSFIPSIDAFLLVNRTTENVYLYKIKE